jgi:hypothetical protein
MSKQNKIIFGKRQETRKMVSKTDVLFADLKLTQCAFCKF